MNIAIELPGFQTHPMVYAAGQGGEVPMIPMKIIPMPSDPPSSHFF